MNPVNPIPAKSIFIFIFLFVLFSFLFTIFSGPAFGQTVYFGGGANLSFAKADPLDFIVQRYNETRTDCNTFCLTDELEDFRNISGITFGLGGISGAGLLVDLSWTGRNQTVTAQGTPPGEELQQRDVKLKANSFDIGIGYASPHGNIRPGLMFSTDVGSVKTLSRIGNETEIKDTKYTEVTSDLSLGFTISGNLFLLLGDNGGLGLLLRPYYQFAVFENDYYDLNAYINSNTYGNDDLEAQKGRLSTFGVKLMLVAGAWGS